MVGDRRPDRDFAPITLARASLCSGRMRFLACLLAITAMTSLAAAEPPSAESSAHAARMSVGLSGMVNLEEHLVLSTNLEVGWHVRPGYWLLGGFGVGVPTEYDPAGSGQSDTRAYEGKVGGGRLWCGNRACLGVAGSLGYHRQTLEFVDSLVDPPMWTEVRDLGFAEARGLARVRMFAGHAALEASIGGRVYEAFRAEHAPGGANGGVVISIGLHATL